MKTIIVDDEIMAIKLVRNYLERDKRVEIVGECLDAGEGHCSVFGSVPSRRHS